MTSASPRFDTLLRRATGRHRLGGLLRALGFEPRLATPAVPHAALGVEGEEGVGEVVAAGERGGLVALLIECTGPEPAEGAARVARRVRGHNPARPYLFIFAGAGYRRLVFASFGLEGELRQLVVERLRPRRSDLDALEELAAREGEGGVALALRHARALDRTRVTRQFFRDFKAQRAVVASAWAGLPAGLAAEREQLGLLLLCRLMFLYFLQRHGHLAGDSAYVPRLFQRWRRRQNRGLRPGGEEVAAPSAGVPGEGSFYRAVLMPLFFGALNTRPERREAAARALGPLPYLNGGLFERHALERRFPALALADDVVAGVFDGLLERYRFTAREAADAAAEGAGELGVDPEMLGRVFEGLMAAERRGASGTFFTPAAVVDRLVREALEARLAGRAGLTAEGASRLVGHGDARRLGVAQRSELARELAGLRVLDPACGSGAFLLGALSRLARLRAALGEDAAEARRDIVARSLHGVDVQDDAALLCALRLWLALAVGVGERTPAADPVPPLPNLDRRIRQGDALVDPLDLTTGAEGGAPPWAGPGADAAVRRALRSIGPLAARYLSADPEERPVLQRTLAEAEATLARAWIAALDRRLAGSLAELRIQGTSRDLFGELPEAARRAAAACGPLEARRSELARLRASLDEAGALPFFSFAVHFAEAAEPGFDLILSNPPWVRAHRWPAALGRLVRQRYAVCRGAGWRRGAELAGAPGGVAAQVDLSLLFLERSLRLLAAGGVAAMLLPAKSLRSLYGAGARRLLLRETVLVSLEDHSLDQHSIFRADAFAAAVVVRKGEGGGERVGTAKPSPSASGGGEGAGAVRITMVRRGVEPLRFALAQHELPVVPGDLDAPWLLAPPGARAALRRMQGAGPPLGTRAELRVRRGVVTGANDVLVVRDAESRLGGLAWIRAEGYFRARRDGRPVPEARRFEALVEGDALRPLVRGGDIAAWRFGSCRHVVWTHDDASTAARTPPPRAGRFLERHGEALRARSGWRPGTPAGALFRLSPATLGTKVAWHDLAATLKAVALPARVRDAFGRPVPLVPLNTAYFIPTASEEQALLLAALFNSLPLRTFARAVAERAKDASFRFLAWAIALLPLPAGWEHGPAARRLVRLSREAHRRGAILPEEERELDAVVAGCYGLTGEDVEALVHFDCWLRGAR